jgi:hypothetical protein
MADNQLNDKSEYSNLIEFLIVHFGKIDAKFEEINNKLDQRPTFKEVELLIEGKLEEKLKDKADKADIDRVLTRINSIGNNVADYRADQTKTQRQVDRHA